MDPKGVLDFARENECTMVDLKFQDFLGGWRHSTRPIQELDEASFELGFSFDAWGLAGRQPTAASVLVVVPDPNTANLDPFPKERTLHLIGDIHDPVTGEPYSRDPRFVARKAEDYLKSTGVGDTACFAPEAEFFIFEDIRFEQTRNSAFYYIDSLEGRWNSGRDEQPNLGYKPRYKEGYLPAPPVDSLNDLRNEMVVELMRSGIEVKSQHHQRATAGQGAIDLHYAPLVEQADNLQWLKYVLKNVAFRNGKTITFMPKPLFDEHGSGLCVRQSIWRAGENQFAGDGFAGLSEKALWYIGGLLEHAPALCALCNPSTNSYKRLVPGCEAPVELGYSTRGRSAAVGVPAYTAGPKGRRVEFRVPDPSCNAYFAFAAMLMAGLDGIEKRIDPGESLDRGVARGAAEEHSSARRTPPGLREALACLRSDHEFLLKGGVFTEEIISAWIESKEEHEVNAVARRPVPWEFALYFDC